jgi:hypothetical protein
MTLKISNLIVVIGYQESFQNPMLKKKNLVNSKIFRREMWEKH